MFVTPFVQPGINAVLIGVDQCPGQHSGFYQWFNGYPADIGKHLDHHLSTSLNHPEDGGFFFLQCAPTACALQPIPATFPLLPGYCRRIAFMSGYNIHLIALDLVLKAYTRLFLRRLHEARWSFVEHQFGSGPAPWRSA